MKKTFAQCKGVHSRSMSIFLSKTGGRRISPRTHRLIAIACALGRINSENLLFNYIYSTIFSRGKQVQTKTKPCPDVPGRAFLVRRISRAVLLSLCHSRFFFLGYVRV